jgi:Cu-Zn family superoxide dismutase
MAVAFFDTGSVKGEVLFDKGKNGVTVKAFFTNLPPGKHGFHIHTAGDLRGEGCKGACDHYNKGKGKAVHGGPPSKTRKGRRHTGDLGNIVAKRRYRFFLSNVNLKDLYGRTVIVHADPDDLGKGHFDDSKTTGHSGARIGCAIIGRRALCETKKVSKNPKRRGITRRKK